MKETQAETLQQPVKQNLWRLIKHAFSILFQHNSRNERISKGEDLIASTILGFIGGIASIIGALLGQGSLTFASIIGGLIVIAIAYFTLKLLKQRFNDLNLGAKGMRWYLGGSIITIVAMLLIAGAIALKSVAITIILFIIAVVVGCMVLWYKLLLQFENGSQGDNKYGADPLLRQPYSNRPYIIFVVVVPALTWLLFLIAGLGGALMMQDSINLNTLGDTSLFDEYRTASLNTNDNTFDDDILNGNSPSFGID